MQAPRRRLACLLWLYAVFASLSGAAQQQVVDVDLSRTLPGAILQSSTFYGQPVFPIIPRTFTTNASNFVVDWNVVSPSSLSQ